MRIARLETTDGARHAIWTGDAWAVVEDGFADPPIRTGLTVAADDARLLAPCEPQVLVGIAHNKTKNNHPLPIQAWHKSVRTIVGPGDAIHARRGVGGIARSHDGAYRLVPGLNWKWVSVVGLVVGDTHQHMRLTRRQQPSVVGRNGYSGTDWRVRESVLDHGPGITDPDRMADTVAGLEAGDTHAQTTAVMPPSTNRTCPLTKFDAGEARNTSAPTRSSTLPQRPAGVRVVTHWVNCSFSTRARVSSVSK